MPLASQERVEGVSRLGRDWVAIGRDWVAIGSQSVAKTRLHFGLLSQSVAIGRAWVAIGRNRSRFGRDWRVVSFRADVEDKTQKSPIALIGQSGLLLLLGVVRFYASTNSSFKYICRRSNRSANSGASMVHRDANV